MTKSGDPTKSTGNERDRTLARLEKALAEARAELKRVSTERDELRRQLARVDNVQAATIALPENDSGPTSAPAEIPSLEELMSAFGNIVAQPRGAAGHLFQQVQYARAADDAEEMLSPQVVFPERFAETAKPAGEEYPAATRVLVLLDPERPIKYPLYKETMTIGRGDIADVQISHGFLSRLHARVVSTPDGVTIEDIESKNGIRVNAKITPRQPLRHGDVIDLGRLRFRFIDAASDDAG
jgi:hypothetical protein